MLQPSHKCEENLIERCFLLMNDYNSDVGNTTLFNITTLPPTQTQPNVMIYFYESHEDLAKRGGGVLSGGTGAHWYDDVENTTGMDIADIMDLIGAPASPQVAASYDNLMDDEYRDERDDSSRLADRHGC